MADFRINIDLGPPITPTEPNGIAGEVLYTGEIVYYATDGKWYKADASDLSKCSTEIRLVTSPAIADAELTLLKYGTVPTTDTLVTGDIYYISPITPGAITNVLPTGTDYVRYVGVGNNTTSFTFNPGQTYVSGDGSSVNEVPIIHATNTSDLVNDGEDGINAFITINDVNLNAIAYHSQVIPATSWAFNHNLATIRPTITVFDDANNVIIPESIICNDLNNLTIYFPIAVSGHATAVGEGGEVQPTVITNTSQLINDGSDGVNQFITLNEVPDTASGLEAINEGNGIGYRIIGRNAADYGNIGLGSIDFSTRYSGGTNWGTKGYYNLAIGENIDFATNVYYGISSGYNNVIQSDGHYALVVGTGNTLDAYHNTILGENITNSGHSAGAGYTIVSGRENFSLIVGGAMFGTGLYGDSYGTTIVGKANEAITWANGSANDQNQPAFVVGNGTVNTSNFSAITRSDAFRVMYDGRITANSTTIAIIDAEATGRQLVTREWIENKKFTTAPTTATSTGTAGDIAYDASYFYVCTATDTWVRTALTTW